MFELTDLLLSSLRSDELGTSLLIYPGNDWEQTGDEDASGSSNSTGITDTNRVRQMYPLVNMHWADEHVFKPSETYLSLLN